MAEITEQDIRKLTEEAVRQLGEAATPQSVEKIVKEAVAKVHIKADDKEAGYKDLQQNRAVPVGDRIIITAFGKNQVGILAGLTGILAKHRCDILDLSQKILQEFFTIMVLVDIAESEDDFESIKNEVISRGEELDLKVIVQHEEIFNAMHRV